MIFNMSKKELAIRLAIVATSAVVVYVGYKHFTKGCGDVATAAAATTPSPVEEVPVEEVPVEEASAEN